MSELYIPKGSIPLDKTDYNFQLRLGLQGKPKTGKTFVALTFANPIVVSFDRGLISHIGRKDVIEIPMYDPSFVDSVVKRDGIMLPPNRKEALTKWLSTEALKLTKEQTLVIDGNTGIQAAYHLQYRACPSIGANGQENKFAEFRWKIDYYTEIMMSIKALKCNVIYLCHEADDRDDKGNINGRVRPLLTGQFVDELQSHFTDFFSCLVVAKPTDDKAADFKKKYDLDDNTFKEWIASTPKECKSIYVWQTQSDGLATGLGTSLVGCPKYILQNANQFTKYKRNSNSL